MILVNVEDHTGNRRKQAKINELVPVQRFMAKLISDYGLPLTDRAGRQVSYRLVYEDRQLQDDETLESAGVTTGAVISLIPEMTAGSASQKYSLITKSRKMPLQVEFVSEERLFQPARGFPDFVSGYPMSQKVNVCLRGETLMGIHTHALSKPEVEVGGWLFGQVFEDAGKCLALIEESRPAREAIATCASLQFTARDWISMMRDPTARTGSVMLGWYHSHPGLGIFFSEADRFTHDSFFGGEPWYVGLVVDPISGDYGAFTRDRGDLSRSPEVMII